MLLCGFLKLCSLFRRTPPSDKLAGHSMPQSTMKPPRDAADAPVAHPVDTARTPEVDSSSSQKAVHTQTKRTVAADPTICDPNIHLCFRDQIFANDLFAGGIKALGFAPSDPVVIITGETETIASLMSDAEVVNVSKGIGLLNTASAFGADVAPKLDSQARENAIQGIGIFKVPKLPSIEKYVQNFGGLVDKFLALPAIQKNTAKYDWWLWNDVIVDLLQAREYFTPEPILVVPAEGKSLDGIMEMAQDEEGRNIVLGAHQELGFDTSTTSFGVDVVKKS
ncbi:hypothetical protein DFH09DRAFT_1316789 [Mycena vulgaris]|nr:hypothetical protein DFH09DRAFT_1316789 [Mycena vulgaris]